MNTIEDRIRHTLRTVAETYDAAPAGVRRPRRRTRWVIAGVGAVALPVGVAAAVINQGPEHVDEIPPSNPILSGDVGGSRYWLVETDRQHEDCRIPVTGVELIAEQHNVVGQEWNTVGAEFGIPRENGCGVDTAPALAHPEKADLGGIFVNDEMLVLGTVHPDVTALEATVAGRTHTIEVHRVDGAGYFLFEAGPSGTVWSIDLRRGDEVLPGSHVEKEVPAQN